MKETLTFSVDVDPVAMINLTDLADQKDALSGIRGVYFLMDSSYTEVEKLTLTQLLELEGIYYIGKGDRDGGVFGRCSKHIDSLNEAVNSKGNKKTRPGVNFKRWIKDVYSGDLDSVAMTFVDLTSEEGRVISYVEEWAISKHIEFHNNPPPCNTALPS